MSDPIVFISHFSIKDGQVDRVREMVGEGQRALREGKPRTSVFLAYLSEDETELTIVHAFADQDAMDLHVEGADERSAKAYEIVEPRGWEIMGTPSESVKVSIDGSSKATGAPVTYQPSFVGGFLRGPVE